MDIGKRLKQLRELKKFSQGEVEKRTKLLRCYISRVENGFTVPSLVTLEKLARAFEVPLYQLFYTGDGKPADLIPPVASSKLTSKDRQVLNAVAGILPKINDRDKGILLSTAKRMVVKK